MFFHVLLFLLLFLSLLRSVPQKSRNPTLVYFNYSLLHHLPPALHICCLIMRFRASLQMASTLCSRIVNLHTFLIHFCLLAFLHRYILISISLSLSFLTVGFLRNTYFILIHPQSLFLQLVFLITRHFFLFRFPLLCNGVVLFHFFQIFLLLLMSRTLPILRFQLILSPHLLL